MRGRTTAVELEQLLSHGILTRKQFIAGMGALGAGTGALDGLIGSHSEPALAQGPIPKYLCLIVLDAFRPDYMNLAAMPALNTLARSGISYDRAWVGQLESETPTGHATISTGSLPRNDGVIGFEWRDPKTGQEALDGWPPGVLAGLLERDIRQSGANSIALAVKAVNPSAMVVSVCSEKVYAADALGGWAADYIFYHKRTGPKNTILVPAAVPGHIPPDDFFRMPHMTAHLPLRQFSQWDYLSTMLAVNSLTAFKPKVLLVNLPGGDVYGHPYGGPATPSVFSQVVTGIDKNINRIVQAYKQANIFDETLFVVTSDHGLVPNDRSIDGSITKAVVAKAGGQYLFHTGGTAAYIYLKNPPAAAAVARGMATVPGVVAAYYKGSSNTDYVRVPGSLDPSVEAAHRYMFSTFAGPTAPDVIVPFRENTIGTRRDTAHGDHGGVNWGAQHVPLILSGPGVRTGAVSHFPARLVDLAPTVLRLMGVPVAAMDGAVLADAMLSPDHNDVVQQQALTKSLTSYQDALKNQAEAQIAEDKRLKLTPPASAPPQP